MGSSKRVEKIYFEIQESWCVHCGLIEFFDAFRLEQWGKQQIRDSKNAFLFNVILV